jgi:hypothetical protein
MVVRAPVLLYTILQILKILQLHQYPILMFAACNGAIPPADTTVVQALDNCGVPVIAFVNDGAANTGWMHRNYNKNIFCN